MPKNEHSSLSTSLDVVAVRRVLSSVLATAEVETLRSSPLDDDADLAIVAHQNGGFIFNRSPFGPGQAVAQVIVEDNGSRRNVELIAIGTSFGQSFAAQRGARNAAEGWSRALRMPNIQSGRKMVTAIRAALAQADPSLRPD